MSDNKMIKDVQELIDMAYSAKIETSIDLEEDQIRALENLNQYCVVSALKIPEVNKKPLKIGYKTNELIKEALVAICLSAALVNPRRKLRENKEYFIENINIYQQPGNIKYIDFGNISPESVQMSIYWEIIEDWKLYCDKECGGIKALIDEKTNLTGLDGYIRGGDRTYEFARFHRKYTEKNNKQLEQNKISTEEAYRNAVVQSVASEVAKQQLLEGKDPMDIINSLLNPQKKAPQEISHSQNETPRLDYRNKK